MKLIDRIKEILYADAYVLKYNSAEIHHNQLGIALIAAIAFAVMSVLNIKEDSIVMLITTCLSSIAFLVGYFLSKYKGNKVILKIIFYIVFVVVFTAYTIMGGNDGFAVLWLVIATYAVMIAVDFRAGFIINVYYLIMLLLVFKGPLNSILLYDYNPTFMLRFPFLFAINFAFAVYIIISIRSYQYQILIKQTELEKFGTMDLSTGLLNRNAFVQYEKDFKTLNLKSITGVFIDVNGLHEVNNREGHRAGDNMLRYIARQCLAAFSNDKIYRMGGDEFLIICENAKEEMVEETMKEVLETVMKFGYSFSYGIETQTSQFNLDKIVTYSDEKMIKFKSDYYKKLNLNKR